MQVHCTDTRIDVRTHKYRHKIRQKERHKHRHKKRQIGETKVQTKSTDLTIANTKRDKSIDRNINTSTKKRGAQVQKKYRMLFSDIPCNFQY